jgi:hypothetical protein
MYDKDTECGIVCDNSTKMVIFSEKSCHENEIQYIDQIACDVHHTDKYLQST